MDSPSPFFTHVSVFCSCNVSASSEVFWVSSEWQVHDSKADHKNAQTRMAFTKVFKEVILTLWLGSTAHFLNSFRTLPLKVTELSALTLFWSQITCPRSSHHLSKLAMKDSFQHSTHVTSSHPGHPRGSNRPGAE